MNIIKIHYELSYMHSMTVNPKQLTYEAVYRYTRFENNEPHKHVATKKLTLSKLRGIIDQYSDKLFEDEKEQMYYMLGNLQDIPEFTILNTYHERSYDNKV